jgi:hypothetical protein
MNIYLTNSSSVRSEEIAKIIKRSPGTVRSYMQILRILGLVEGVPGPKGGYKPTYKAYEVLSADPSEKAVRVFVNGEERDIKIERVILKALSNPNEQRAVIRLEQEAYLSKGDRICIVYAEQLVIDGRVSGFGEGEIVMDVEKLISFPQEAVNSLASPLASIDAEFTIRDAAVILSKRRAYCGIVMENGNAAGILTLGHIAKAVADGKLECRVKEVASPDMVVVDGGMTVSEAIRLMNKGSRILVVAENGKFIGLVSEKDLLRCLLEE